MNPPNVETVYYLGDLTDDLQEFGSGFYIEQLYRVALKNVFSIFRSSTGKLTTKWNVKGINLT